MIVPLALTVLVCLPVTLVAVWLIAASPLGQSLGAPPRGTLSLREYARTLVGRSPKTVSDDEWAQFSAMLSQVASGQSDAWSRFGGPAPVDPPARPATPSGVPLPASLPPLPSLRSAIRSPGSLALVLPLTLLGGLTVLWLATSMLSGSATQVPNAAARTGLGIVPTSAWYNDGPTAARATAWTTDSRVIVDGLTAAGFDDGCRTLPGSGETVGLPASATPALTTPICTAVKDRLAFDVFDMGSGRLVLQVRTTQPPGLNPIAR